MSSIRINSISVKNYRSFGEKQDFLFPNSDYKKPVAIVGYNNSGKTNFMNAIKFGLYESVREDTFGIKDFHKCEWGNYPCFALKFIADIGDEKISPNIEYTNISMLTIKNEKIISSLDYCNCYGDSRKYGKKWNIKQNAPIYYVNFHNIKDEISTQKSSWGNLKSFLGKHIERIVKTDESMHLKKETFENEIKLSSSKVIDNSQLSKFIETIEVNYSANLRNNACKVDFGLPNYEDIFLKMMFKIGLNGDNENLIPIDHFGDGFISMFVMAVIQAIAETNAEDKCLFLFEEPESFLHENHQEYFYKTVLCGLSEKGHQVIYTTHSDKMIDPFDTKGLIRLEMDDKNQTVKKYNNVGEFNYEQIDIETGEVIEYSRYNEFIKTIEPNLNRILFSKKVILVEGPNDVLVYKFAIKEKVKSFIQNKAEIIDKDKYADTYLNFENISIVCHHGKTTALYLIELCKWFKVDYFVINDWDFELNELDIQTLENINSAQELKEHTIYTSAADSTTKGMITTNWNLIHNAGIGNIHFNVKKLESVIGYDSNDKSSMAIWNLLNSGSFEVSESLFPESLVNFLGLIEK
jgi:putative ATP-dependent endonuclease of OLD family